VIRSSFIWPVAKRYRLINNAIDALLFDQEGHCIQLYYYMEQVGWDGRPRPQEARRLQQPGEWPAALEPMSDTFGGEAFLGPWA
jgi:hypothetical protein